MFTTEEVSQYIRLTLKQHKLSHLKIKWVNAKSYLGMACCKDDLLVLNKRILCCFSVFKTVLLHEIAHFIQYRNNGNKFLTKGGRYSYHGPDFKKACKELGIPARTKIPC